MTHLVVRSSLRAAKRSVLALERLRYAAIDSLPGWLTGPFDDRLRRLVLGLESVCSDWDVQAMQGLTCSRSVWRGHAAFAHSLVLYFRPETIVDLGVLSGCSTVAMAMALKRIGSGRVYAVDTWSGDEHTGGYSDRIYENFLSDLEVLGLQDFVVPLRMTFEEAAPRIPGPVGLLHVDGFHTFRAASDDFRLFRDRLLPGAPVLFHDVANRDFPGMLAFWRLMSLRYRSYRRPHSSGLGVVLAPGGDRNLGLPVAAGPLELYKCIRLKIAGSDRSH